MDLDLQSAHLVCEVGRKLAQLVAVNPDPVPLHARDDRHQRPVDHFIDPRRLFSGQPRPESSPQPERHVGILGGIAGGGLEIDFLEAELILAGADHVLIGDAAV